MSAPDWRARFASVLESHAVQSEMAGEGGEPDYWLYTADAVLDAIKAAGYRLHRDHDYWPNADPVRIALEYPNLALRCRRCGVLNTDIGSAGSCEPREEPQG